MLPEMAERIVDGGVRDESSAREKRWKQDGFCFVVTVASGYPLLTWRRKVSRGSAEMSHDVGEFSTWSHLAMPTCRMNH